MSTKIESATLKELQRDLFSLRNVQWPYDMYEEKIVEKFLQKWEAVIWQLAEEAKR